MPALNFNKQFADLVKSGKKRQTIRAMRKRRFKVGDKLYLYTGMRTKACRKLGDSICTYARPIEIRLERTCPGFINLVIEIDGREIKDGGCEIIWTANGFSSIITFIDFFKQPDDKPFTGQLIRWKEVK